MNFLSLDETWLLDGAICELDDLDMADVPLVVLSAAPAACAASGATARPSDTKAALSNVLFNENCFIANSFRSCMMCGSRPMPYGAGERLSERSTGSAHFAKRVARK
jgi:hypothetical protein